MNIYFWNLIITIVLGSILLYPYSEPPRRNKKVFVITVTACWILISGLRSDQVGRDTVNYMNMFDKAQITPWSYYLLDLKSAFSSFPVIKEALFPLLSKVIGLFTSDHIVYKFVIATIFMVPFGKYVFDYSDDPCLSFAIYDVLLYNMFSTTGYRQVVAVAIVVLLGGKFLFQRRAIPFFILVIIGALFHKSTIFYGLLYFISEKKLTKPYLLSVLFAIIIVTVQSRSIFVYLKGIVGYDIYVGNEGFQQLSFLLLFSVVMIFALYTKDTIISEEPNAISWYNSLLVSALVTPILQQDPSVMRLVYLFIFPMLLLLPKVLKVAFYGSSRVIAYCGIYGIFAINLIRVGGSYTFFWQ